MNIRIAIRFIRKNFIQSFTIFFAVLLGVAAMFFIFTIGDTLEEMIKDQSTMYLEHIISQYYKHEITPGNLDYSTLEEIKNNNEEITYISYRNTYDGKLSTKDGYITNFSLHLSHSNDNYLEAYGLSNEKHLVSGRVSDNTKFEIMLDDYFAKQAGISIGDTVTFTSTRYEHQLLVTGTYDLGLYRVSRSYAYSSYDIFPDDLKNSYSIIIQTNDPMNVKNTASKLDKYVGIHDSSRITTWNDLNPDAELLNLAQVAVILVIDIFILLAVFIVVLNMLNYSIKQKYKQLGILKAMGLKDNNISKIFTIQTLLLSIPGLIVGLITGTIIMIEYHNYMIYPDGTHRFNLIYNPYNYVLSVVTILITILLASLLTMRRLRKNTIIQMIKT